MQHPLPDRSLRVGVVQAEPVRGDIEANVACVVALLRQAARDGVRLLVFPEKFLGGYEPDLVAADPAKHAVGEADPRLAPISDACRAGGIAAVVGAASLMGGVLQIVSLVFGPDGILQARHAKQCLFGTERQLFAPGTRSHVLELDGWRLAMAVCYDSGFAEHARAAALAGCHAYVVSALFSQGHGHHESRIWMPARALDNTMYVLLSNHVGTTGGWAACGGSAIWDPLGHLVAEGDGQTARIVIADLDPACLARARTRETMLADAVPVADLLKKIASGTI